MSRQVDATATINRLHSASANVAKTLTASAVVEVKKIDVKGTLEIEANGTYDVAPFASVEVNVPVPKNYGLITWNGSVLTVS